MVQRLEIALVVEDVLSRVLMEKVLAHTGRDYVVLRPMVERGVGNIRRSVTKYLNASRALPHVVLADLDQTACAPLLRQQWGVALLPRTMLFRGLCARPRHGFWPTGRASQLLQAYLPAKFRPHLKLCPIPNKNWSTWFVAVATNGLRQNWYLPRGVLSL